jgi:hypothetical protein
MTDAERIAALEAQVADLRVSVARALSASSSEVDELRRTVALLVSKARHTR